MMLSQQLQSWYRVVSHTGMAPLRWLWGWVTITYFGSTMLVRILSPASYSPRMRANLVRHVYIDTAPILGWFSALVALLTLIITRIVVVAAYSYGMSQYALELLVRVLMIELIPLTAALFVALRCTIPSGAALVELRTAGHFRNLRREGFDPVSIEVLPRLMAGVFACITLAALSMFVSMVVAYLAVYGPNAAGIGSYTRLFGNVFDPMTTLIFALKTLFFAFAVSIIPMASGLNNVEADRSRESAALQGLVQMFGVLLLLEALSLVGNYI